MIKLFLIVLYKEKISSCRTFLSFKENKLFLNEHNKFIIWDNSPTAINTVDDCRILAGTENIDFYHTPDNVSLSKIYNFVIKNHEADLYCIFDQDSEITRSDYDSYLDEIIYQNPNINVFLPQIYSNESLYSPGRFWIFKGSHYIDIKPGIHEDKKYTAITSGMCIRKKVFFEKNIWFNEDLQLYGIDTCFFNTYRKVDKKFFVLDMVMNHDLSQDSLTPELRKLRVRNYYKCLLKTENNIVYKVIILMYMGFCRMLRKI